jgi:hypothetical protein
MKLSTSLVPVIKITSSKPPLEVVDDADALERAAQLMLEVEGLVNPIILRRTGLESYEVVDGHFEYHAAARAREINLRKGEMVNAYIIEPESEELIKEQVELLRKPKTSVAIEDPVSREIQQLGSRILRLETSFQGEIRSLNDRFERFDERTTLRGIEAILRRHLETIHSEIDNLSKDEKLRCLAKTQDALSQQLKAIKEKIDELTRIDLLRATEEDFEKALKNQKTAHAAWEAIEYWRQPGKKLTWENLKKSTRGKIGLSDKIKDFGDSTYKKLKEIGYIGSQD